MTQIHKYTLSSKTTRRVTTGKTAANITLLPWCRLVAFPAGRFSCARAQSHPFHSSCSQQLWLTFSLGYRNYFFSDFLGKLLRTKLGVFQAVWKRSLSEENGLPIGRADPVCHSKEQSVISRDIQIQRANKKVEIYKLEANAKKST